LTFITTYANIINTKNSKKEKINMTHIDTTELQYDDDMHVLQYLVHTVHGLLPVSGSHSELAIDDPELFV
jgi:hypothetical protein